MKVSIIAAMTDERVIGLNGKLPWHIPEDLKRFKKITMGHPVIMGRKTFDSVGKPLPGRLNIVVSRNPEFSAPGIETATNIEEALEKAETTGDPEIFILGGAEIYKLALPKTDRLYLTLIHSSFPGDTYFPVFNFDKDFKVVEKVESATTDADPIRFTFLTADRTTSRKP
jgi:dihydrofolate reductase